MNFVEKLVDKTKLQTLEPVMKYWRKYCFTLLVFKITWILQKRLLPKENFSNFWACYEMLKEVLLHTINIQDRMNSVEKLADKKKTLQNLEHVMKYWRKYCFIPLTFKITRNLWKSVLMKKTYKIFSMLWNTEWTTVSHC